MIEKTLKSKLTRLLKKNGFKKVTIVKSSNVKGWQTILYAGFDYISNDLRWITPRGANEGQVKDQIDTMYACIKETELAPYVSLKTVGLAEIPVIALEIEKE